MHCPKCEKQIEHTAEFCQHCGTRIQGDRRQSDIQTLTLQLRLEGVREANKRARFALGAAIIASLAILTAVWNAYGSWNRFVPLVPQFATSEVTRLAQEELLKEWVKNQTVSVDILGIRVSIFDGALLGSIGLFVISLWLFFSVRRANRAIGFLLHDTKKEKLGLDILRMVYHGVISTLIFIDTGNGDYPVCNLDDIGGPHQRALFVRWAYRGLFFLPAVAIASIVIGDMSSLFFLAAPFRQGNPQLFKDPQVPNGWVLGKLIGMELIAVVLMIQTFICCWKCQRFETCTSEVIKEFMQWWKDQEEVSE